MREVAMGGIYICFEGSLSLQRKHCPSALQVSKHLQQHNWPNDEQRFTSTLAFSSYPSIRNVTRILPNTATNHESNVGVLTQVNPL